MVKQPRRQPIPARLLFSPKDLHVFSVWKLSQGLTTPEDSISSALEWYRFGVTASVVEPIRVLHPHCVDPDFDFCPPCQVKIAIEFLHRIQWAWARVGGPKRPSQQSIAKRYMELRRAWHTARLELAKMTTEFEMVLEESGYEPDLQDAEEGLQLVNEFHEYPAPVGLADRFSYVAAGARAARELYGGETKQARFDPDTAVNPKRDRHEFCRQHPDYRAGRHAPYPDTTFHDTSHMKNAVYGLQQLKIFVRINTPGMVARLDDVSKWPQFEGHAYDHEFAEPIAKFWRNQIKNAHEDPDNTGRVRQLLDEALVADGIAVLMEDNSMRVVKHVLLLDRASHKMPKLSKVHECRWVSAQDSIRDI